MTPLPFSSPLTSEHLRLLELLSRACRHSILDMVTRAQSGHPGGALSSIDFLVLVYALRLVHSNEPIVVSHGHISPAVYSILAELGVLPKQEVLEGFRRPTGLYEGHVNRKVQGIHYGTGPLGIGGSVASAYATARTRKLTGNPDDFVFLMMGDGEQQEGQVYEMMQFAAKEQLGNLILFVDYNQVQLSDSLENIMPVNIKGHYEAAGWQVLEANGHDFESMWAALETASQDPRPSMILGHTIMGHGSPHMEGSGREYKADWHGKAPKPDDIQADLDLLRLKDDEQKELDAYLSQISVQIKTPGEPEIASKLNLDLGEPRLYKADDFTDCRSAYGDALLDLAKANPNVVALTADLGGSVKTTGVLKERPNQHFEVGIAEQHMVSLAGGLSLNGLIPFCSTFGAFMTSRAKDQARVNDINECNVKMVSTHCGLSVGEDGPTHQAIDDISSMAGFMHTWILEPADPNQCDRMIRYIAGHYGNVYMRMGRAKIPVILKEDGSPFYDLDYHFELGKADLLRKGSRATLVAAGPMVVRALEAAEALGGDIEVIVVSSFEPFDEASIVESAKKTGHLLTIHDHHVASGLAHFVNKALVNAGMALPVKHLGVDHYQLSGSSDELYEKAGLTVETIVKTVEELLSRSK